MEKMLMTQALDERDLLVKKLTDKIEKFAATDVKKRNAEKTQATFITETEFISKAQSNYQQINDLINRYMRLDAAIHKSNAETTITLDDCPFTESKMSVQAAIALRSRLKGVGQYHELAQFEIMLAESMTKSLNDSITRADVSNNIIFQRSETMQASILGSQYTGKERPLDVVETYINENTCDVLNPLNCAEKALAIKESVDKLIKNIETAVKVSNATTVIEF